MPKEERLDIVGKYSIDVCHWLPLVPEGHKCKSRHGHTYHIEILLTGPVDERIGWFMDYADVDSIVKPVLEQLDHKTLNEVPGLENPTCENLAVWLARKLTRLPISEIRIGETDKWGVRLRFTEGK